MFEDFYYDFLNNVKELNYQRKEDIILVNEKKLRQQLQKVFLIITKSKDYILKSLKVVKLVQKRYENSIDTLGKRLSGLGKGLRGLRRRDRSSAKQRCESQNTNKKSSSVQEKTPKTQSYAKQAITNKIIQERSKTPEFKNKEKSFKERSSNKQRVQIPAPLNFPLANTKKIESMGSGNENKSLGRTVVSYAINSPVKAKLDSKLKMQENKKFPNTKISGSDMEATVNKGKDDNTLTANLKEIKAVVQKESKSSLSNMGQRSSLYELRPKPTLEKMRVNKTSTVDSLESSVALRNSIIEFRKHLTVTHGSLVSLGTREITICHSSVLTEFMKKLERRNTFEEVEDQEDSDLTEINPLEL